MLEGNFKETIVQTLSSPKQMPLDSFIKLKKKIQNGILRKKKNLSY